MPRLVLAALVAGGIALVVRAPGLGDRSLWLDEAFTASRALLSPADLVALSRRNQNPPAYTLAMAGWVRVFGISEAALRAPSLVASAASAGLLFALAWRLFGVEAAIVAALLGAASEPLLDYAREARSYALLGLMAVLSFWLYVDLLERPRWRSALGLGLVNALAMYTHFTIAFALVAQAVCAVVLFPRDRRAVGLYALSQGLALVIFLPWLGALGDNLPAAGSFWLEPPDSRDLMRVVGELGGGWEALLASAAVLAFWVISMRRSGTGEIPQRDARRLAIVLAWAVVPVVLAFVVSAWVPVFLLRYVLYAGLGWIVWMGAVVARLPLAPWGRALVATGLVALSAMHLDWQSVRGEDWRRAAQLVVETATRESAIVIVPIHACLPFAYYADPEAFADPHRTLDRLRSRGVHCLAAERELALSGGLGEGSAEAPDRIIVLATLPERAQVDELVARASANGYVRAGEGGLRGLSYAVVRRLRREAGRSGADAGS